MLFVLVGFGILFRWWFGGGGGGFLLVLVVLCLYFDLVGVLVLACLVLL